MIRPGIVDRFYKPEQETVLTSADNGTQSSRRDTCEGFCSFIARGLIPYSGHGEEPRHSEKTRKSSEIENAQFKGVEAGRAADRAGFGGIAQSRDQSRRKRSRLLHRIASAAGQFLGSPLRRRSRR